MKLLNSSKNKLHNKKSHLFSVYPKRNLRNLNTKREFSFKNNFGRLKDQGNKRPVWTLEVVQIPAVKFQIRESVIVSRGE